MTHRITHRVFILVAVAALMLGTLLGCQGAQETAPARTLVNEGLTLISLMEELATSEPYFAMMSANPDIQNAVSIVSGESYEKAEAVYAITVDEAAALELLGETEAGLLSDRVQTLVNSRLLSTIPSQLNAMGGAMCLAASSLVTANRCFVMPEKTENTLYLYTFAEGAPAMVNFVPGEDNTVLATGWFILDPAFSDASAEGLSERLGLPVTITEVSA